MSARKGKTQSGPRRRGRDLVRDSLEQLAALSGHGADQSVQRRPRLHRLRHERRQLVRAVHHARPERVVGGQHRLLCCVALRPVHVPPVAVCP
eukprot:252637-Rhodomonas_salina.1